MECNISFIEKDLEILDGLKPITFAINQIDIFNCYINNHKINIYQNKNNKKYIFAYFDYLNFGVCKLFVANEEYEENEMIELVKDLLFYGRK